jgi:predicted outer membrane repeat protein
MAKRQRRRRKQRRHEHSNRQGWKTRHSVITGAGIAATATLGLAGTALADSYTYYVGSSDDTTGATDCTVPTNTDCTLRDAVTAANNNSGNADYVVFTSNVSGAVTLSGTDILIDDPVYIYGRGADVDTVSGNGDSRIFDLEMTTPGDQVAIYGLRLTGGSAPGGGAIYDDNADLRVVDSVLTGNEAEAGGAIFENGGSNHGRNLVVAYSTFDHNTATYGGAIAADQSAGIIGGSTLTANTADNVGGGVFNFSSGGQYGARLFDSTISGNSSTNAGGGVTLFYAQSYNSILANNSGDTGDTYNLYLYGLGSLFEAPGSPVDGASNIIGVDPQLGGLANNGGTTPTLRPAASSPVVDQGVSYAYYDQRGVPFNRIVDNPNVANAFGPPYGAADIGSVELTLAEGPQATPSPPPAPPPVVHKKKKKCKKKKHKRSAESAKKKKCKKKKKHHSARPAAHAIHAWQAQAAAHPFEGHWGDRAWRFDR